MFAFTLMNQKDQPMPSWIRDAS